MSGMPRFLTGEWASAYNEALAGVSLPAPGPDAGVAAADGHFTVAQHVTGGPDGDVRLLLVADGGALHFDVGPLTPADPRAADGDDAEPQVTVVLAYRDAVAMATGELTPADALNQGRVRVRGDLSVLVAGQQMLEAARAQIVGLGHDTTY